MRYLALLPIALLTAACATGHLAYRKPGATETQLMHDQSECAQLSTGTAQAPGVAVAPTPAIRIDRKAVDSCMAARGYTLVTER